MVVSDAAPAIPAAPPPPLSTRPALPSSTLAASPPLSSHPPSPSSSPPSSSYQKLSQREHILLRPEPYLGSSHADVRDMWTLDPTTRRMRLTAITYTPALLHLFDELLINAADNAHRNTATTRMTHIRITLPSPSSSSSPSPTPASLSILNDGASIPLALHDVERVPIPELIFGHLLTSSNYDDSTSRYTGGRHGFGAKLVNIFSHHFTVDIGDGHSLYTQTWTHNMTHKSEAVIRPYAQAGVKERGSFTRVTFAPDLTRFGLKELSSDVLRLMERRAYDIAASVSGQSVRVLVNDEEVPVRSFRDYIDLFPVDADTPPISLRQGQWEVVVTAALPSASSAARDVTFVNGVNTSRGGTHVQLLADRISRLLLEHVQRLHKELSAVTASAIRQHFSLFVNLLVANPSFDSQTKETLITPLRDLPTLNLPPAFVKQLLSSPLVASLVEQLQAKQAVELQRRTRTKRGGPQRQLLIPKLDDALLAGTSRSSQCTLILTEGDSAKALVLAGLSELGRERWGVFPLRGKLLNVRDVSAAAMLRNEEVANVIRIVGLEYGKVYPTAADRTSLRYGRVMLMTDQDHDGSHIKGLFINLLHTHWPSLLTGGGFLQAFSTAIIKVRRGGKTLAFDTLHEYRQWKERVGEEEARRWTVKYYKGLGTNSAEEGREYFRHLARHRVDYTWLDVEDDRSIEMAFSKQAADARKTWLQQYDPQLTPQYTTPLLTTTTTPSSSSSSSSSSSPPPALTAAKALRLSEFIHRELIVFSHADLVRSIPSLLDGLKPVQRKVLFGCFRRRLTGEVKVAQLSGYVSEQSGYHHGEASLSGAIVGMAQHYTGSNNLPLLFGSGQFGTRHMGGKDAASARYIFTRLDPLARMLFDERDDALLTYRDEDGQQVEPEAYLPIVPLVLVNGADGIGTGFSTHIPPHHPLHVIDALRRRLRGVQKGGGEGAVNTSPTDTATHDELLPWMRGFRGTVRRGETPGVWVSEGLVRKVGDEDDALVEVLELPWGKWTHDYKEFLTSLVAQGGEVAGKAGGPLFTVRRVTDFHTNEAVRFRVELSAEQLAVAEEVGLLKAFKLTSTISTLNMHLFDHTGHIQRYSSAQDIIEAYFPLRLALYHRRRAHLLASLSSQLQLLTQRARFIRLVLAEPTLIAAPRHEVEKTLQARGFPRRRGVGGVVEEGKAVDGGRGSEAEGEEGGWDYLLDMRLGVLVKEEVERLEQETRKVEVQLVELQGKTAEQLWSDDLDQLQQRLERMLGEEERQAQLQSEAVGAAARAGTSKSQWVSKTGPVQRPAKEAVKLSAEQPRWPRKQKRATASAR